MNHETHVPSDEELHRRLHSFMQAEIAADAEKADEESIRRELAQITREPMYPQGDSLPGRQSSVLQLARFLVRQAEHYAPAASAGYVVAQPRTADRFWDELHEVERRTLRQAARPCTYPRGEILCHQDDPSDHVIIIESGWAKVTSTSDEGRERVLALRGPGDLVGESAAFGHRRRSATVRALAPVQALLVPVGRLTALFDHHPYAWRTLSEVFVHRIDEADRQLSVHASAGGVVRLALLLLFLAERYGAPGPAGSVVIRPPLSQQDLASWVGTSRETVARAFKVWREDRLVDTSRRKIMVISPVRLRAFADDRAATQEGANPRAEQGDRAHTDSGGSGHAAHSPDSAPRRSQHCVLFAVDIAGFTDARRNDVVQLAMRDALYRVLREAFDAADVPWEQCHREDRGDGVLVVIPATMPSSKVVHPLLDRVRAGLRHHNSLAIEAATIRLRVAVHIGEVHADAHGVVGSAVNHLFRLLDAPAVKRALVVHGTDVALIVSDYFFESVIRHSPAWIDPGAFRPVTVPSKGSKTRGWMRLPDIPPASYGGDIEPAASGWSADQPDMEEARPQLPSRRGDFPSWGAVFTGPITIHGDAMGGNKIVYQRDPEEP